MNSSRDHARPWDVDRLALSAQAAHDLDLTSESARKVRIFVPTGPAIVLGSTQRDDIIDRDALTSRSMQVARRRSGGGAVFVDSSVVWIDFSIARDDPLWVDDIGRSMQWLGRVWSRALTSAGIDAAVHEGPPLVSELSRAICFCGIGHGEVIVDGRKVVGISQRRTREGARFQTMLMTRRDDVLIDVLHLADRDDARAKYADAVYVCDLPRDAVVRAVIEQLSA